MAAATGEVQSVVASWTTYIAAGIVIALDIITHYLGVSIEYMDSHALGLGVIIAIITCAANIYFRVLERKDKLRQRLKRVQNEEL